MARQVSLQSKIARDKLKKNLMMLSNASVRKSQKLQKYQEQVRINKSNTTRTIFIFSFLIFLLVFSITLVYFQYDTIIELWRELWKIKFIEILKS